MSICEAKGGELGDFPTDVVAALARLDEFFRANARDRAERLEIEVEVTFADADGVMLTREGDVRYRSGDAIVTGVCGERWPIARDRFAERYRLIQGNGGGPGGRYARVPGIVTVCRLQADVEIPLQSGCVLRGRPGDWLVRYGDGDYGVVGPEIFVRSYRILGANDM